MIRRGATIAYRPVRVSRAPRKSVSTFLNNPRAGAGLSGADRHPAGRWGVAGRRIAGFVNRKISTPRPLMVGKGRPEANRAVRANAGFLGGSGDSAGLGCQKNVTTLLTAPSPGAAPLEGGSAGGGACIAPTMCSGPRAVRLVCRINRQLAPAAANVGRDAKARHDHRAAGVSARKRPTLWRGWRVLRLYGMMLMGFETRTEETVRIPWQGLRPTRDRALAGSTALRMRLGGCTSLAIWPGAVRYVQRETLKAHRLVSSAGFELPAAGLSPAMAFESQTEENQHAYLNCNGDTFSSFPRDWG